MIYHENPPKLERDKRYVDDLTNLLIENIGSLSKIKSVIHELETTEKTQTHFDQMEISYVCLEETMLNMDQIRLALNVKLSY